MLQLPKRGNFLKPTATLLVVSLTGPFVLAGCGGGGGDNGGSPPPPVDATNGGTKMAQLPSATKPGMSTKKKVVLLVGAAALYYMYKQHQKRAAAQGQTIVYYRSEKNGRVYYRDPKTHGAVWVTPPTKPVEVDQDQATDYQGIQGYDNGTSGRGINDLFPAGPSAAG